MTEINISFNGILNRFKNILIMFAGCLDSMKQIYNTTANRRTALNSNQVETKIGFMNSTIS